MTLRSSREWTLTRRNVPRSSGVWAQPSRVSSFWLALVSWRRVTYPMGVCRSTPWGSNGYPWILVSMDTICSYGQWPLHQAPLVFERRWCLRPSESLLPPPVHLTTSLYGHTEGLDGVYRPEESSDLVRALHGIPGLACGTIIQHVCSRKSALNLTAALWAQPAITPSEEGWMSWFKRCQMGFWSKSAAALEAPGDTVAPWMCYKTRHVASVLTSARRLVASQWTVLLLMGIKRAWKYIWNNE